MSGMSEPDRLRLFFALWPDPDLGRRIWDLTRACVAVSGGRPVKRENLHLTLAFLGDVDVGKLPELRAAAAELHNPGFEFSLDTLVFWARPGVLVLQPGTVPEALSCLAADIRSAMAVFSAGNNSENYRPHVTLARKAGPARQALGAALLWRASEFCLVSSVTDPGGARYEPLARYHLLPPTVKADRE